ncbi:MAG: carboxyl transferase [Lachnospiraceae bacterium]|nr:carboxyl transferase [Lachnospiraceae bacterium]
MSDMSRSSAINRIATLLDDSSFVEIGGYVTARSTDFNLQDQEIPSDGVITGYGTVEGKLAFVYSQDAAVLGGSIGEMHARKIVKLYELAMKTGAPVVGFVDCAGLRLQEATDALHGFGALYASQINASGVIPQITGIFGVCGGGMAVVPTLTDFTFMESSKAKLFVNSPNALEGNSSDKNDTASARFQSGEAGIVDGIGEEAEIIAKIRELVAILPSNNEETPEADVCTDDLNRYCNGLEAGAADSAYALSEISDNGYFFEVKADYAKEMVTGFIKLNGTLVGGVANRTVVYDENGEKTAEFEPVLTSAGAEKAADFVKFCDSFEIPVLTLSNVKGFKATVCEEKHIARAAAKLTYTFAEATVPKVTVITGAAYGSAGLMMNSGSIGADIVYAWPEASVGMMEPQAAAKIMYAKEIASSGNGAELVREKAAEYAALQASAVSAAKRGYVDDIITAAETRKRVIASFEMLYTKRVDLPLKKHGTV